MAAGAGGGESSEYLKNAAAKASGGTPIVVAFDLADTVSTSDALRVLQENPPEALSGLAEAEAAEMANLLGSIRGITITISAESTPRGNAIVHFGADASKLGDNAKPVLLELLARQGMALADLKSWTFEVSGNSVVAEGPFSSGGVRRMMRTIKTPSHPAPVAKGSGDAQTAAAQSGSQVDKAAASKRYFATINNMIDELSPAQSLGESAQWLVRDAKQIDGLPILGVDPELVAWGGQVSAMMRDIASLHATGQRQVRAATSNFSQPTGHFTYENESGQAAESMTQTDWANYRKQRQAAAEAARTTVTDQTGKVVQDLINSRNQIRAAMTQKHGVEF